MALALMVLIRFINIKRRSIQLPVSAKIKKLTPEFEKHSSLFHTKVEVEGLYQSLSEHQRFHERAKMLFKVSNKTRDWFT